jgi:hypothetical protein
MATNQKLISCVCRNARILGPYLNEVKQRREVVIYFSKDEQFTLHLSRFKMQEHLGRLLESHEEVDHIDDNKLNDELSNLQVLKSTENHNKTHRKYEDYIVMICYQCESPFVMSAQQQMRRAEAERKGKAGPFCQPRCSAKYGNQFRG